MKNKFFISSLTVLLAYSSSGAKDVNANIFLDQEKANHQCPLICNNHGGWNGNWVNDRNTGFCGCKDVDTVRIMNQNDAKNICDHACSEHNGWSGNWTNKDGSSVCGCNWQNNEGKAANPSNLEVMPGPR
jgi:hypothetical protein